MYRRKPRRPIRRGTRSMRTADAGVLIFQADLRKEDSLEAARDALVQTVEQFGAQPPSAEEVERARTALCSRTSR